jgi:ribosomal protein S18 acetylase RimI-like enzyme
MDTPHISIEKLRRVNISEAAEVLAQAYYSNPLPLHAFGKMKSSKRLIKVRRIYRGIVESGLLIGHVYVVRRKGVIAGIAVAYSPNANARPIAMKVLHAATVTSTGIRGAIAYTQFSKHIAQLKPTTPHWHLFAVGVAPGFQRQGIGQALVQHFNRIADKDSTPSFLTTTREDQVPFYNALGYKVTRIAALPRMEEIVVRAMHRDVEA